jgi:hypothetical protein
LVKNAVNKLFCLVLQCFDCSVQKTYKTSQTEQQVLDNYAGKQLSLAAIDVLLTGVLTT